MPSVLYCHGFLSGSQSSKAQQTKAQLEAQEGWTLIAPDLNRPPRDVDALLRSIVLEEGDALVGVMGSSLGGYWAARLQAEFPRLKAVLINPCLNPWTFIPTWSGWRDLYYENRQVWVAPQFEDDFKFLEKAHSALAVRSSHTVVILGQKDEVLDWRLAHDAYKEAEQWLVPDGDHGLTDFAALARASIAFLTNPYLA